jgi:hypothetical protein
VIDGKVVRVEGLKATETKAASCDLSAACQPIKFVGCMDTGSCDSAMEQNTMPPAYSVHLLLC